MGSRLCLRKRCQAGGLQDVHQPAPQISVRQCIAQGLLLSATWVLMVVITKVKIALIYSVFQRKWPLIAMKQQACINGALCRMVRWIATKEDHAQKIMSTTVPGQQHGRL